MIVESVIMALMTYGLFRMPIILCFVQGFASSAVAAAIIVPQMMVWNDKGYGKAKGVSSTLFASCTFDNIVCLILFGICKTVAFKEELEEKGL